MSDSVKSLSNGSASPVQRQLGIAIALLAVYLIWGSTYLGIRFAIDTLPPLLMAGTRFVVAGALLYAWAHLRGAPRPSRGHWSAALVVGGLLLFGGNGGVTWAEQYVPSGLAALLVALVPLWMALLDWLRPGGVRPGSRVILGLVLGFAGVAFLVSPGELASGGHVNPLGAAGLIIASISWAIGSLYAPRAGLPTVPLLSTALQMLAGGALLLVAGAARGELANLKLSGVSLQSTLALGYLIVFGSLVGFSAYSWLLRVAPPALVSTYAYVNPVVAVFLGWALASEPVSARTLLAAAVIVTAVGLITTGRSRGAARAGGRFPRLVRKAGSAPAPGSTQPAHSDSVERVA